MMPRLAAVLAPLLLVAVLPLAAQAGPDRAALDALRDSVAAADTVSVAALRARSARPATALDSLRLALVERTLGEMTGARAWLDSSEQRLEGVLRRHEDWPDAWYELARVKLALHDAGAIVKDRPYQRAGTDYLHVAGDLLARALAVDPAESRAGLLLGLTVLRQTVQPQLEMALPLVRRAAAAGGSVEIHHVRGVLERELMQPDSAVEAFRTYAAVGGDPSLARLEIVRTLLPLGRSAWAESLYYEGAALARSPRSQAAYRFDLRWIADSAELAGFDTVFTSAAASSAPDSAGRRRVRFLAAFWRDRDVADGRAEGERLTEHYRRLAYALRHFRRPVEPRQTTLAASVGAGNSPVGRLREISGHNIYTLNQDGLGGDRFNDQRPVGQHIRDMARDQSSAAGYARLTSRTMLRAYADDDLLLDDRGIIYIRHGEPHERATSASFDAGANESWKYLTPDGEIILHFVGTAAPTDLVEQLELIPQLLETRARLDPRYQRMADGLGLGGRAITLPPHVLQEDRDAGQRAIVIGTTTDSHVLRFDRELRPIVQAFGVREAGAPAGELLVVFAAPAGALAPVRVGTDSVIAYPLRFRLIAQRGDGEVVRLDTLRAFATRRVLDDGEFVTGRLAVPVPAGEYTLTAVVGDGEWAAGGRTRIGGLHVPAGGPLAMSDLVLGRSGSGQTWRIGGREVPLNPLNTYPEGGEVEIYYQLRGLVPGGEYRTTVQVSRRGADPNDRSVRVDFTETAEGDAADPARTIGLGGLRRGEYLLTVTVTGPDGRRAERRQYLNVVGR